MKGLRNRLQYLVIAVLTITLFSAIFISYLSLRFLFIQNNIEIVELNIIYTTLGGVLFLITATAIFAFFRNMSKIKQDTKELQNYFHEVSEFKNYDALVKIKNFKEFLHISILLKNIVKRLYQKEKKISKK